MKEKLALIPDKPGVYLMKDEYGQIIYIGKAISLKKRVKSYFLASAKHLPKTKALVKHIKDIEYIITDSEIEALILESNLIKKHQPKYNIALRDDKSFPYIKVTINEKYPRVLKTRDVLNDGGKYFGPYTDVASVNSILDLINNIYMLKKCAKQSFSKNHKPCLNEHIGQCLGMCVKEVDIDAYLRDIDEILELLQGKSKGVVSHLTEKMTEASKLMDFEKAAIFRDYIRAINAILEKQKVVLKEATDLDILAVANGTNNIYAMVFFIRQGILIGREKYTINGNVEDENNEIMSAFIKQFYAESNLVPKELIIHENLQDKDTIEALLSIKRKSKVKIVVPNKGEKRALLDMVIKNVIDLASQSDEKIGKEEDETKKILIDLMQVLNLAELPKRIESYDISNTNGADSVASMVVFENGKPKPSDYRRFKVKTIEGPNDYGSMQEIVFRRFKRFSNTDSDKIDVSFSKMPQLLLIDGGDKQVKVVQDVLNALKIDIPIAGMVKDDYHKTRGLIYKKQEFDIKTNRKLYSFIYKIQEEVHRFAITYHRSLRAKDLKSSVLDNIDGIGETRKKSLLIKFGSIKNIKSASLDELLKVDNINKKTAENIKKYFEKQH